MNPEQRFLMWLTIVTVGHAAMVSLDLWAMRVMKRLMVKAEASREAFLVRFRDEKCRVIEVIDHFEELVDEEGKRRDAEEVIR